ncbi:hypothetical protein BSKO_05899 [Bryopsis sp. KO-2023]|nr:hypothetical protein BSKO_05899 [Bryopsis sp. KO-2023]
MENTPQNLKGGELRMNEGGDTWDRARQRGLMEDCRTVHPVRYKPKMDGSHTAPPAQQTPLRRRSEPAPLPVLTPARTPGPWEPSIPECEKQLLTPLPIGTPILRREFASTPVQTRPVGYSTEVGDSGKVASHILMNVIQRNAAEK